MRLAERLRFLRPLLNSADLVQYLISFLLKKKVLEVIMRPVLVKVVFCLSGKKVVIVLRETVEKRMIGMDADGLILA